MRAPTGSCGERAVTVEFTSNITHQTCKETIQGRNGSGSQEPRKLNMEEKRKLEKLLLADIDSAVARYEEQAQDMRRNLIEKLTKNPSAEIKKLFASYSLAQKQAATGIQARHARLRHHVQRNASRANKYNNLRPSRTRWTRSSGNAPVAANA